MSRSVLKSKNRQKIGYFSAWPHDCHESDNYKRLSLVARALLMEFLGQLRRANNGDLCCAVGLLKPRGWKSRTTIERARQELEKTGWIIRTRQGGRNRPNLYAVTWLSIEACNGKLEVPAGTPRGTWRTGVKQNDLPEKSSTSTSSGSSECLANGQAPVSIAQQMVKSA